MKHLLLPAALLAGAQPVLAGVDRPNGGTLLAVILLALWVLSLWAAPHKQH